MEDIKALNDEQLENAAGGDAAVGGCRFSGPVGMDSAVVGQWYYIVTDNSWKYGKLYKTAEEKYSFGFTRRYHYFAITIRDGKNTAQDEVICGDNVVLYTTMEKL